MNRGDPEAPQRLCDIDKVHYCFVCIHYETYFAKWVVGWWEIIRRPRKVWVTTELAGCISLYSHCFSTPSVLLMKKRRTVFTVLHICIWTTDFLLFLHIFPETKRKKKLWWSQTDMQASFALLWTHVLYLACRLSTWMCLATPSCSFWLIHKCYTVGLRRRTQLVHNLSNVPLPIGPFNFMAVPIKFTGGTSEHFR